MSTAPCLGLRASSNDPERTLVRVNVYQGAYHAWDRLQVPATEPDPFGHLGQGGPVRTVPNVDHAYRARDRVVAFFQRNL